MEDILTRVSENLVGRLHGPLTFRLILQPLVAAFLAFRAGLRDAREGRPPYAWTVVTDPARRRALLREGWKDVAKVFIAAVIIDVIYEIIAIQRIYLGESLIVAAVLALLPYLLLRGPAARIASHWYPRDIASKRGYQPHAR
jgi:predicted LPLAT superfamily acyltransferase